jgi:hypothetical protein
LTTTNIELTEGKHYWEVELLSENIVNINIGISRPNLDPRGYYMDMRRTDAWFIDAYFGALYGNGKLGDDEACVYTLGDRVGVLLDLVIGSLHFFMNGVQHGPGYPAGSVTGPVVHAVQMYRNVDDDDDEEDENYESVRLLPNAEAPFLN